MCLAVLSGIAVVFWQDHGRPHIPGRMPRAGLAEGINAKSGNIQDGR